MRFIKALIIFVIYVFGLFFFAVAFDDPDLVFGLGIIVGAVVLFLATRKSSDAAPKAPMNVFTQKEATRQAATEKQAITAEKPQAKVVHHSLNEAGPPVGSGEAFVGFPEKGEITGYDWVYASQLVEDVESIHARATKEVRTRLTQELDHIDDITAWLKDVIDGGQYTFCEDISEETGHEVYWLEMTNNSGFDFAGFALILEMWRDTGRVDRVIAQTGAWLQGEVGKLYFPYLYENYTSAALNAGEFSYKLNMARGVYGVPGAKKQDPGASAWGDTTRTNRKDPVKPAAAEFFEAEPAAPSKPAKPQAGKEASTPSAGTTPDIPDAPGAPFVSDEALEANEELAQAVDDYEALRDEYEQAKEELAERQQELADKLAELEEASRAIEDAQESYEHTGDWDREAAKDHVRSYLEGLAHYDTSMALTDMEAYIDSLDEEPDLSELENMALNAADLHDNYDSYEGVPSRYDDEEDYF